MKLARATAACLFVWACLCLPAKSAEPACDGGAISPGRPSPDFEDHGDGTLTDGRSGLMWMRCSAGQTWSAGTCVGTAAARSWAAARDAADEVNRRGSHFFNDWRVPKIQELATLAEHGCRHPRIDRAWFPNTPADVYWTASTRRREALEPVGAFSISFGSAGVAHDDLAEAHFVRLVRNAR